MDNRNKEIEFAKVLSGLKKDAVKHGNILSVKRLNEAFSALDLDEAQLERIREYFNAKGIKISNEEDYVSSFSYKAEGIADYELEELFARVLDGEKRARDIFIEAHMPMVGEIARLYEGQGVPTEDLVGEGYVALVAGIDLLGAVESASNAQEAISGMIMNSMEELVNRSLKEKASDNGLIDKVQETAEKAKELREGYRRNLTIEEFSDETGLEKELIENILFLTAKEIEGISNE